MAKFSEIFSTTWKVVLSVFLVSLLISLGIGFIYVVIGGFRRAGGGSSSDEWTRTYHVKNADEAYTKMPKSEWDGEIKRCIKEHTVIEGMTKDQVKQAVGGGKPWSYSIITLKGSDKKCIRYEGEQCVEYPSDEVKSFALHFTPKGNLIWDEDSIGLSVYGKDLRDLPVPQPVPLNDSGSATIDGVAQTKRSTAAPFADSDQAVKVASETYHLDPDLLSIVLNVGTEFNVRPLSPKGLHNTCANCWSNTTSISLRRLLLIRTDRNSLISIRVYHPRKRSEPLWRASSANSTSSYKKRLL